MPELTVERLRGLLDRLPLDMRVFIDGYEDGFDDPVLEINRVCEKPDPHWWDGKYSIAPLPRALMDKDALLIRRPEKVREQDRKTIEDLI